jgi:hypothetical protein
MTRRNKSAIFKSGKKLHIMAKAGKGKIIQLLSPENYIRTRARSLPLHECLVNTRWEDAQMVNVMVARKHSNGNITACLYLVDLYCQGVKDTTWFFNMPALEYGELKNEINGKMDFEEVKYELVHNIIYAALEFAEEYGFYPHRDFTGITIYMLEEDSDEIELIDIECGIDGKPAYMRTPNHSKRETEMIIAKLEKNPGPGNYVILDETAEDTDETGLEDEDDYEDEYEDEFAGMTFNKKKEIILPLLARFDSLSEKETACFTEVASSLFNDLCDSSSTERYFDEIKNELKTDILPYNEIPDELLGVLPGTSITIPGFKEQFVEIYKLAGEKPGKARKIWKKFRERAMDHPASAFLELSFFYPKDEDSFMKKLNLYASRYPDYTLLKLMRYTELIHVEGRKEVLVPRDISSLFPGRSSLHMIELVEFLKFYILSAMNEKNPHRLKAVRLALMESEVFRESDLLNFYALLSLAEINFITEYFKQNPVN